MIGEDMDDLISRQAVIDEIKNYASMLWEKYHEPFPESTIMELIQALPPVQPKMGHWIEDTDKWGDEVTTVNGYKCSECGEFNGYNDNFCPNCGAKMDSGKGDE